MNKALALVNWSPNGWKTNFMSSYRMSHGLISGYCCTHGGFGILF